MGNPIDKEGYHLKVLGTCMTNTQTGSQHLQIVEARFL